MFRPVLVLAWLARSSLAALSCKDLNGNDVDWFVGLKLPTLSGQSGKSPFIEHGTAFYYADVRDQNFKISPKSINDSQSAVGRTVVQAIDAVKSKDKFWAFYNDQHPGQTDSDGYRAHAKGVIAFDATQGFWLIHSAPRFADPNKPYYYPVTGTKFGQSLFCMTFAIDQLDEIGRQLHVAQPSVVNASVPPSFEKYAKLKRTFVDGQSLDKKSCSFNRTTALKTKGGQWLTSFEKHRLFGADLYSNMVAPGLHTSLFVETWLNGPRDYSPTCTTNFWVTNNRKVSPGGIPWSSALDHSKWAVSADQGLVCIGDINRQASQGGRGGGTMCLQNKNIWSFFRKSVVQPECCAKVSKADCSATPSDSVEPGAKKG